MPIIVIFNLSVLQELQIYHNADGISVDYSSIFDKAYTETVEAKRQTYIYNNKPFSVSIILLIFPASGRILPE